MPAGSGGYKRTVKVKEKLDELGQRWPWFGTVLAVQKRYTELNGNYLASAVTLSAFLSIFPLLLVALAVIGFIATDTPDLAKNVVEELGLRGEAADNINKAVEKAQESRRLASIIGIAGLLWSGLGLVAAFQYAINAAWQVTGRGWRDKLKGLAWLAGSTLLFVTSFGTAVVIGLLPSFLKPLGALASLSVNFGLWVWTFRVLSTREVGWKALVPGAVVGALGLEVLKYVGGYYVPGAVTSTASVVSPRTRGTSISRTTVP